MIDKHLTKHTLTLKLHIKNLLSYLLSGTNFISFPPSECRVNPNSAKTGDDTTPFCDNPAMTA